ncbi:MAG: hypothetical protein HYZ53_31125 [Planctomycetes bacterium]|nr:hypothetical protein [Planctomycetota bacterium]
MRQVVERLSSRVATLEFLVVRALSRWLGLGLVVRYLRNPNPSVSARLLRAFGATVGEGTTFKRSVLIENAYEYSSAPGDFRNLRIGARCYIGDGVYFDLTESVTIEDNAVVSAQAAFLTHEDCNRSPWLETRYPRRTGAIRVGHGAWLGTRATVLLGVTMAAEGVLAAHSLLRADAEPRCLYAGVPARKVRSLEPATGA